MKRKIEEEPKRGFQIKTNINQVIAIVLMFLAMFVLPIQLYALYESNQIQPSPYAQEGQVQGASTSRVVQTESEGSTLGILDTIDTQAQSLGIGGSVFLYIGIAGVIIAIIILLIMIFRQ
ncbi:MAG TPA: hypothetical protein ENI23_06315 [bacterium]|nr:hypothetical protein [bacterium]